MPKKPTIVTLAAAIMIITGATFSDRVFASSANALMSRKGEYLREQLKEKGVGGVVESITQTKIIIKSQNSEAYDIDVSNSKFFKAKATPILLSDIKVGDHIFAKGTVTGNSVVAEEVFAGAFKDKHRVHAKGKKEFQGVIGVVTSVNGDNITVTGKDNVIYVIDARNANVKKGVDKGEVNVSQIRSGDHLFVRGEVTGTSVVATDILDGEFKFEKHKKTK